METLHYLLLADHLTFQKVLMTRIKDTGLTPGQPKVLDYLRCHDGAVQKDIAAACRIEPATITSVLLGMERKDLIRRQTQNGNRRSLSVHLTDQGRALAERVATEFDVIEAQAYQGFTQAEQTQLRALLSRVQDNMTRKKADPNG